MCIHTLFELRSSMTEVQISDTNNQQTYEDFRISTAGTYIKQTGVIDCRPLNQTNSMELRLNTHTHRYLGNTFDLGNT